MSNTAISTSIQGDTVPAPTFEIFHSECFLFPTAYIEMCALHGGWRGYEWWQGIGKIKRWMQSVDTSTVAVWATCGECGKLIKE